ncbi:transcriptional repressor [Saccharopolyspora sp. HNM0983]|uniref:Transcriptional repressor n=1 Tax=Saccharopolyspora montiporae TaxID=2781240 RepID=A0A929FXY6_9PSEU|nr:Fur family transcriptional regulator [Saccharopolyspora sp. HNM0983]MBE9372920.1 transcriptional repressor [Saccharopolyspora sp. HNM0983]
MPSTHQDDLEQRSRAELQAAGLRVTAPRVATLDAVAAAPHAEADDVTAAVRERLGTVSKQAVYDVLNALTGAGLLRRVDVDARSAARYEIHRHDNHHHMVCRICGRLEDVPCAIGAAPCLDPADDLGFDVEEAELMFRGVCSTCRSPAERKGVDAEDAETR